MGKVRTAALLTIACTVAMGATALLPARIDEVAREVERVRGRRFDRSVPASEIDQAELRKVLRAKLAEGFPAPPEDTLRTLVALGLMEEAPNVIDRLIDLYASQVVAFYDPEPRRFFLVKGGEAALGPLDAAGGEGSAEKIVFAHELMHALQDESMHLDRRMKDLKDNGDRGQALQSLLEGEATLVMIKVAVAELPGAEAAEEMMAPLLSAGALDKTEVPKGVPGYFVEQLFSPYVDGTAYVRAAVKHGGFAEVDRLWKNPPASTAEILHGPSTPQPVENLLPANVDALAPPGYRKLYLDTLGEWTLRFLLRRTLPEPEADRAAALWRGDRIAFFSAGKSIAYFWTVRCDGPGSADRFAAALLKARNGGKPGETIKRRGSDVIVTLGYEKPPS
ncbi:MAG TPA: hypothetical protein VGS00_10555 [Thermoanaerobaculia bacterium]|nr:hypothetical protein [Thermoanaerobaculia bacterium]